MAGLLGVAAALYYARLDLTLSHYDARGHLMVARRVIDNLTPGWTQLGAVWLPLPHLLNLVPAQWDWSYRTGAVGALLSVASLSIGLGAFAGYLLRTTSSAAISAAVPLIILLNPNVLYLQSTPMTEPLLFGLSLLALVAVDRWLGQTAAEPTWPAGLLLAALVLTRYEGWAIAGALVGLAGLAAPTRTLRLVCYPVVAIIGFLFLSKGSTGNWFVTSGFFEPNNPALGHPMLAIFQVIEGASRLGGVWVLGLGLVGVVACVLRAVRLARTSRIDALRALLPLALVAAAALPVYAFSNGHPVRIRYMVALAVAAAALSAYALARLPQRLHFIAAGACVALSVWVTPPISGEIEDQAPMVREAQWERPYGEARRAVTAALADRWDHTPIMASMGSLGHYMQQMSAQGFDLRDFLHEGNGDIWKAALKDPKRHVRWMLIEESAEGGDMLAALAREDESFLSGFTRVAEGGGVALYARR
ncbi:MAG: hypothetical protein HQ485_16340 [Acidobacteria bacterium]|nr:hypothetical protein [Acidobacteriota bacterium]